jgi:hypothetical protein
MPFEFELSSSFPTSSPGQLQMSQHKCLLLKEASSDHSV